MPFGRNAPQQQVSKAWSTLAPVGGINDLDPLAAMGPEYCLRLKNWFPGNTSPVSRQGYREWATNLGMPVRSLMPYYDMTGVFHLFAATDVGIYDVTNQTDAPPIVHPTENGYYKHVTFGNVANQFLVAVNGGSDPSALFDGTNWIDFVQTSTPTSPGEVSGIDPGTFSHVTAFKRRLWFVQSDTTTAWYLPTDAVAGVATPFYLSGLFKKGGRLLFIIDWSVDSSAGLDNKLVFVSDLGEAIVYAGNDPDDALSWSLEASIFIAPPMGDKAYMEIDGDILIVTTFGLKSLTRALVGKYGQTDADETISKRINRTLNQLIETGRYGTFWEVHNLQSVQALSIMVPPSGTAPAIQFTMNILTGAWADYDMPINCATTMKSNIYFGTTDGRVCLHGGNNYLDGVLLDGTGGDPVEGEIFTAFTYMDVPTQLKHWKLVRPIFQASRAPNFLLKLNTDFATDLLIGSPAPPDPRNVGPTLWDHAIWDESTWMARDEVYRPWVGVSALGFCCALLMKTSTTTRLAFTAIEYVYEEGGIV
jgi:hypothetical protein